MKSRRSILRQTVGAVLLLEMLAALLLIALTAVHERGVRRRAFSVELEGKAGALLSAVGEADDASDGILFDTRGLHVPPGELYQVSEIPQGRVLGRSGPWPIPLKEGFHRDGQGRGWEVVLLRGVRVVDPGERGGGTPHRVDILYGAPLAPVDARVLAVIRFQAMASASVLLVTGLLLAGLLRRALEPLGELTATAAAVSPRSWVFRTPPSAAAVKELAPLGAALEEAVGKLQRSMKQQRRMTGDAAHELKTGVAIVKSSLQLLALRERSGDEYREGLRRLQDDCKRIEQTIGEMLLLARAEGEPAREGLTADLHAAAAAAMDALGPVAALRGIALKQTGSGPLPVPLSAREAELLAVNLLENAIRHSRPGEAVELTLAHEGNKAVFRVRDSGKGIDAEALPHIFEPFYRADEARDRVHGGAGLGLAICKALCEKAGGTIQAENRGGAVFTMMLPCPAAALPAEVEVSAMA